MKKIFFVFIIILVCVEMHAKPKLRFGSRAGVNSSFARSSPDGYSVSSQVGFNVGVYAHITEIWKRLYIQPGVDYYFNSYKFESRLDSREDRVSTHTVQIPITAGYVILEKNKFFWKADTGPMFSILAGVSDNDFGITRDYYKPLVGYWRMQTYIRISKMTINAGFDAAMTKLYKNDNIRAHTWYAGIGFNL